GGRGPGGAWARPVPAGVLPGAAPACTVPSITTVAPSHGNDSGTRYVVPLAGAAVAIRTSVSFSSRRGGPAYRCSGARAGGVIAASLLIAGSRSAPRASHLPSGDVEAVVDVGGSDHQDQGREAPLIVVPGSLVPDLVGHRVVP